MACLGARSARSLYAPRGVADTPRRDQRGADVSCDLRPVKRDGEERQPRGTPKQLVHDRAIRRKPGGKREYAEKLSEEARDEVIKKGGQRDQAKPPVPRHPASHDGGIWRGSGLVHRVHQCHCNEIPRPDHRRRVNYGAVSRPGRPRNGALLHVPRKCRMVPAMP